MDQILTSANNLKSELLGSEKFALLQDLKNKIANTPELNEKMDMFIKMSSAFEEKRLRGITAEFEEERRLGRLYGELILYEDAKKYFETANYFAEVIMSAYEKLDEAVAKGFF
ncbi:MAG: YlbF family regulator [Clostridiales bacterium]|jgi:cell fate (sporulation/competence/biofilm development) regulator YlbF (YheA/YmcA/DUF963 family)|nr:YlbF family regulator [Clostridiales bacterium]